MFTQTKLIIAGAAVLILGLAIATLISDRKFHTLERRVEAAQERSAGFEKQSQLAEAKAGEYVKKIEYLEGELADREEAG